MDASRLLRKAARPAPSMRTFVWNTVFVITATTIEVWAALALDGWLSVALWALAVRNVVVLTIATAGLVLIAVESVERERSEGDNVASERERVARAIEQIPIEYRHGNDRYPGYVRTEAARIVRESEGL